MKSLKTDRPRSIAASLKTRRKQRNRRRNREARFEQLETRNLLATLAGGVDDHWLLAEGEDPTPDPGDGGSGSHSGSREVSYLPPRTSQWPETGYLSNPSAATPANTAIEYLRRNAGQFGLTLNDLNHYEITDEYTSSHTGVTHVYFQQTYRGLPVANALANVNIAADGSVVNASAAFIPGLSTTQGGEVLPAKSATETYDSFANAFGFELDSDPEVVAYEGGPDQTQYLSSGGVTDGNVRAELQYVPTQNGVKLAWQFDVARLDDGHWYDVSVGSDDGAVLNTVDFVYNFASYNVFPEPVESPADGNRAVIVDPQDPIASPFGWHDVNGLPGPDFFDTRGNNVFAQEDRDGDVAFNSPLLGSAAIGNRPSGGPNLDFDYPLDLNRFPVDYQDAAITNLFYWVNLNHDVLHRYGFDEQAGNFQAVNYSGQGNGNDPVHAFAQAGANLGIYNNAFWAATPDGLPPIISMFEFDLTIPFRDGDLVTTIITHEFGHGVTTRLTGGPNNVGALSTLQSSGMGEGWSDFFAQMFTQKATDTKFDARPEGTYPLGQPENGPGVRTFPYSYDMTINPLTYGAYNSRSLNGFPHDDGEIWASALLDMNWLLIDKYGFDPDLQNGNAGNNLAMQLVMDGLKLQPADPSFLDGRDAILAADLILNDGVNHKEIWEAFARRGMGVSAFDGGSSASPNVIEAFDLPNNPGVITGTVWSDQNGNGLFDGNEPGTPGTTVFIDLNGNGRLESLEPTAVTDANGNYAFEFFNPGRFVIGAVIDPAATQTFPPPPGDHTVTVVNGQTVPNVNFGARPGDLQSFGVKWHDLDGDGRFDEEERGIPGVWIYVDYDGDGRMDLAEPKAQTAHDGTYNLLVTRPGTHDVREVIPPGWFQTFPGGTDQSHQVSVVDGALNVNFNFGNTRADDYGDAPESYGTLFEDGGAVHPIQSDFFLGATIDAEADGIPTLGADGDDLDDVINDEDGVEFNSVLFPGASASVDVTVTTGANSPGRLNAWIDYNGDGVFTDDERIANDLRLDGGVHTLTFDVPRNTQPGLTYARFRYGYTRNQGPTGPDISGEVEDYRLRILSDQPEAVDDQFAVQQNSFANPLDVLQNDIPSLNGPIVIFATSPTSNGGRVNISATGQSLSYTPAIGFSGTENFTYSIRDQAGAMSTALVTVNVLPSFVNPIAIDDSFDVPENTADNVLDVLANDFSGQNPPISLFDVLPPQNGTAIIDRRGTIEPEDDVILYTPNPGAGVTDQFQYIIEDAAGVQDSAAITVHIKPGSLTDDLVQYRMQATSLTGEPIDAVGVGEQFLLQVFLQDLRADDGDGDPTVDRRGVAAGYLDVLYNFQLVSVTGEIIFGPDYLNATSGTAEIAGLLNEVGALQSGLDPLGADDVLLFSVPLTANGTGVADFVGDPADITSEAIPPNPEHDTLLFEPPEPPIGLQQIRYINDSLTILGSGGLPLAIDNTFSVPVNSSGISLDVLANDVDLVNPPLSVFDVGATSDGGTAVRSADGLSVIYSPRPGFQGTEQFTYTAVNAVGLKSSARVTVQVGSSPKDVNFRLETTNLSGTPIGSVLEGDDFQLRVYVQDVRTNPPDPDSMGIFSAYLDVLYDSNRLTTISDPLNDFGFKVSFGPEYDENGRSASDALPNIIDELGAFQTAAGPLGPDEFLLAVITYDASAPGVAQFAADPADILPLHEVLTFEPVARPPLDRINYGSTSISVIGLGEGETGYTNPSQPLDVNADQYVTPNDALWVINATNEFGAGILPSGAVGAEGEIAGASMPGLGFVDTNGDGFLSAIDVLRVVNYLNKNPLGAAEGEASLPAAPPSVAPQMQNVELLHEDSSSPATAPAAISLPLAVDAAAESNNLAYHAARNADAALSDWADRDDGQDDEVVNEDLAEEIGRIWDGLNE